MVTASAVSGYAKRVELLSILGIREVEVGWKSGRLAGAVVRVGHENRIAVPRQAFGHVTHRGAQAESVDEQDDARPLPFAAGLHERRVAHSARCLYLDVGNGWLVPGGNSAQCVAGGDRRPIAHRMPTWRLGKGFTSSGSGCRADRCEAALRRALSPRRPERLCPGGRRDLCRGGGYVRLGCRRVSYRGMRGRRETGEKALRGLGRSRCLAGEDLGRRHTSLAIQGRVRGLVDCDHAAVDGDAAEQSARARIGINLGQRDVGGRRALSTHGARCDGSVRAQRELATRDSLDSALRGEHQNDVGGLSAGLQAPATPGEGYEYRIAPRRVERVAYGEHSVAVPAAEEECDLGDVRNHRDAVRMGEQRVGQSLVRHALYVLQHLGCRQ